MSSGRVTLLSDFGTADGYAAAMAGVIAAAVPDVAIDHASHAVPAGDIFTAALALYRYAFLYPEGTVHLVVVDPGVGTERRAAAARVDGRYFVAPDNGVLTRVLAMGGAKLVEIDPDRLSGARPPNRSTTFHGRDLFAPAAALLARGEPLDALGPAISNPVMLELPEPIREDHSLTGEVLQVDRFGNLISNIPAAWLKQGAGVRVEDHSVGPVRRTYGDVAPGELVALVGSLGLLEISVRDGSAAERLGVGRGSVVQVVPA